MKMLLSGYHNPFFPTITEYMENAIRYLGHDLIIFDDRQHMIPGRIRYRSRLLHRLDIGHLNKKLVTLASDVRPHIAIITGGHRITAETINKFKSLGIVSALWTIDPPSDFQPVLQTAPFYDHIFCQGTEAIELLEQAGIKGAHWLPMACDPVYHHSVTIPDSEKERYTHDIAFVGSFYPLRAALFEPIAHFDLAIWGPGWDLLEKTSPLIKCIQGLHTPPSEWLKIYSSAKIVLAPHYQDPEKRFPVYQASPRIFEAMACGAFVISNNQRDVFTLFKDGSHLVRFDDSIDLANKVKHFLDYPEERATISLRGRNEVWIHHTYSRRIETLLSIVFRQQTEDP
jgi:spore maturation protein CgeB